MQAHRDSLIDEKDIHLVHNIYLDQITLGRLTIEFGFWGYPLTLFFIISIKLIREEKREEYKR